MSCVLGTAQAKACGSGKNTSAHCSEIGVTALSGEYTSIFSKAATDCLIPLDPTRATLDDSPMIVTIDGEAGSGKSTAARKLAARLQIPYLDTGAMYRAIAHAAITRGVDLSDASALLSLAQCLKLDLDCGPTYTRVSVDGLDVSEAIRSMEVSAATSPVAKSQPIRDLLVAQQRELGRRLGSFVTEGRDQGSVVFADAAVKFVLIADVDKRAERRYHELAVEGEESVSLATVRENLIVRDAIDAKQWEPLLKADRTIVIDTTELTIHDVVDRLADEIANRHLD